MIKLDKIKDNLEVDKLLNSKKQIFNLIKTVNGSMLELHRTIKTSKEIEELANEFFKAKNDLKEFKTKSGSIDLSNMKKKLSSLKNIKLDDVDFI